MRNEEVEYLFEYDLDILSTEVIGGVTIIDLILLTERHPRLIRFLLRWVLG